jgi:hypothetical protein
MSEIEMTITPQRGALIGGQANVLHALVKVSAPDAPGQELKRTPLNLALVIDRSGSMNGTPLHEACRCAEFVIDSMHKEDQASLVVYDNEVDVLVPSQPVAGKAQFKRALAAIESGGMTALFDGWRQGAEQAGVAVDSQALSRVLLLSDGCANEGLTDAGEATNINVAHSLGIDPTDVRDLTRAEIEGRQKAIWALEALRKYTPGFQNARLRSFNSSLGTRESREVFGDYVLTEEDVKNQARFDDAIGIVPEFLDAYGVVIMPTTGRYFQFPYRSLLPQKVENLLVAGRCVSADRIAFAATRQMMCCSVTGQGAGVAAAVSVKDDATCRKVDIAKVQKALERQGVRTR